MLYLNKRKIKELFLGKTPIKELYCGKTLVWKKDTPTPGTYWRYRFEIDLGEETYNNITSEGLRLGSSRCTTSECISGVCNNGSEVVLDTATLQAFCCTGGAVWGKWIKVVLEPVNDISSITYVPYSWTSYITYTFRVYGIKADSTETLLVEDEHTMMGGESYTLSW